MLISSFFTCSSECFLPREVATLFCRLRKPDARLLFCCAVIELPWFSCFVLFCFAFVLSCVGRSYRPLSLFGCGNRVRKHVFFLCSSREKSVLWTAIRGERHSDNESFQCRGIALQCDALTRIRSMVVFVFLASLFGFQNRKGRNEPRNENNRGNETMGEMRSPLASHRSVSALVV